MNPWAVLLMPALLGIAVLVVVALMYFTDKKD